MSAASSPPSFLIAFIRLYCLFVLCTHVQYASSLEFSFDFSNTGDPCGHELVCTIDASFRSSTIELTSNDGAKSSTFSQGRVWYAKPVPLWNALSGEIASFSTTFSFSITPIRDSTGWGDGMAFFLARYSPDNVLARSYGGGLLGLLNNGNNLNAIGDDRVVAVEFDTLLNPEWDSSEQHVGIDVNSIKSVAYTNTSSSPVGMNLTSQFPMKATVHYYNGTKLLTVDLQIVDTSYHVNASVDLKVVLPEEVAVGFSAGTGVATELHRIMSWSFSSTLEEKAAPPSPTTATPHSPAPAVKSEPSTKLLVKVLVPTAFVSVSAIVGLLLWLYHELAAATDNFAEGNLLGRGAFGSVYKGRLSSDVDNGQQVAIKKLSSEPSSQGRKEFEAEVRIISRLRHRNIVQLLGWCDSPRGLLLVYELVPEGSLHQHIHNKERLLTWSERYKIILGLGSALRYLHLDWEQCVVHGDIKPINIMLDSSYNAKLGDFGLARLLDHGTGPQTTEVLQGTPGYMDPEFLHTQKRSTQLDVYSFGIVLLEIVSGRQPVDRQEPSFMLLKWVLSLYSQGSTLDAADPRLRSGDEAEEHQMQRALEVGLWCARRDPSERPSLAQAMHALQSEEARLPALSPQMYNLATLPSIAASGESSSGIRSSATTGTARSLDGN